MMLNYQGSNFYLWAIGHNNNKKILKMIRWKSNNITYYKINCCPISPTSQRSGKTQVFFFLNKSPLLVAEKTDPFHMIPKYCQCSPLEIQTPVCLVSHVLCYTGMCQILLSQSLEPADKWEKIFKIYKQFHSLKWKTDKNVII